jgi:site-specific DNA recombinase
MKTELEDLEAKHFVLTQRLADRPLPSVHPKMAETYREKVTKLCDNLAEEASRDAARDALRGLIDRITLDPTGEELAIVVYGSLAAMLNVAEGHKKPSGSAQTFASALQ